MGITYYLIIMALYLWVFVLGACIGSFLNVVIYRLPNHIGIAAGRSFCPKCHHMIRAYDNIPLISWIRLGGKCRDCGEPISKRYPGVELLTGILFVLIFLRYGFSLSAILISVWTSILIAICFIDHDTQEIPNGLVIGVLLVGVISLILIIFNNPQIWASILINRAIGACCISIPMLLLTLLIPGAFGGGDIKLMFAAGWLLGWQLMLVAMFIALLIGGGYAVYLMISGKAKKGAHIAFGPALTVGLVLSELYGMAIVVWYASLF